VRARPRQLPHGRRAIRGAARERGPDENLRDRQEGVPRAAQGDRDRVESPDGAALPGDVARPGGGAPEGRREGRAGGNGGPMSGHPLGRCAKSPAARPSAVEGMVVDASALLRADAVSAGTDAVSAGMDAVSTGADAAILTLTV